MKIAVLIVEDEFLLRANAVDFMEESGFTVHEASNADEAIALLELHDDIRVVFTDIHMPGSMDGLKLVHYVRGRWPPIKLIITSADAKPRAEDMPVDAGSSASLTSLRTWLIVSGRWSGRAQAFA
jgi:CheY-like chemotaxis protein